LTQQFSIGQDVGTTADVTFNQVTASNSIQIGDSSTIYTETGISGSIDITGSFETTGDLTVQGDTTIAGTLTANEFHTSFTSASIIFASGSTKFGDTIDDTHEFTGSLDVTGSLSFNSYNITEISNDTTLGDSGGTSIVTENAVKTYLDEGAGVFQTYQRKSFTHTGSFVSVSTASFTATTASAPTVYTATSEDDFMFFINGAIAEYDALTIQQSGSYFYLKVDNDSIGYDLKTSDEIVAFGKFNS
jgi:hypothetical protein